MTRSGVEIPWRGAAGNGEIIYQPIVSHSTDEVCEGSCSDACRHFTMNYEQGDYRARYGGLVCATDSSMRSWALAAEPRLISASGTPPGQRQIVVAVAAPAPMPAAVAPAPDISVPQPRAEPEVTTTAAAEIPPPEPASSSGDSEEALKTRLVNAFIQLAYMMPNDPRPATRAFNAGLRAFLADERLDETASMSTLVERAEAAQKRSETAQRGECKTSIEAVVLVCGRRS